MSENPRKYPEEDLHGMRFDSAQELIDWAAKEYNIPAVAFRIIQSRFSQGNDDEILIDGLPFGILSERSGTWHFNMSGVRILTAEAPEQLHGTSIISPTIHMLREKFKEAL